MIFDTSFLRPYLFRQLRFNPSVAQLFKRLIIGLSVLLFAVGAIGCAPLEAQADAEVTLSTDDFGVTEDVVAKDSGAVAEADLTTAIFAGGCFWCMEQPFDALPGVVSTTSGYTGGGVENPTYSEVSRGGTGHFEAMAVRYDPAQVSYETLLTTFWHNIDPLDSRGQFCDKGSQYRSAIFYETPEQQSLAEVFKAELTEKFGQPIATEILPVAPFYDAEDYHQNYYQTRPVRYKVYRFGCGRDQRLDDLWGADAPVHD